MSGFDSLSAFLERELREGNFDRKTLAQATGTSQSIFDKVLSKRPYSVNKVIESRPPQITVKSLLGIANYFNHSSIDEMLGRDSFIPEEKGGFKKVAPEEAMSSLREFINERLQEEGLTIFELSKNCGFGKDTFSKFMKSDDPQAAMSTSAVIAVADYFNVPTDRLLGRKHIVAREPEVAVSSTAPKFLENMGQKDIEAIEAIRKAAISTSAGDTKKTPLPPGAAKPSKAR